MGMLVGITLPAYSVHFSSVAAKPFGAVDAGVSCLCLAGILTAMFADNTLYSYVQQNKERAAQSQPKVQLLDTGLWRYSRHPNYFGEQLWWWAFSGFGVYLGQWWVITGTAFNSLILAVVTGMTEQKMIQGWTDPQRIDMYRDYQRRTS